ncbi:MAG: Cystine-binding periplasmic protein precursor [Firmicutes bacterium ADurb.Bin193]|nr:MAG: Cystine-binding periplasmic protein precursor [Firmicutes bacterium ADurb.Bin193]
MKRIIGLILVAVVLTMVFTACGLTKNVPDAERKSDTASETGNVDNSFAVIKAKGKIIVGLDDSFPPMGFRDEKNEIVGFDIDMAKAVAEIMGVEVEFKPIVWDNKMLELNGNNIDLIWNGFTVTPERESQVLFSKPYLENRQIIIVLKDSGITKKADLAGKKVGLQGGSSAEDALKSDEKTFASIGEKNVKRYEDNLTALMDLDNKRIDAVVMDEVVCKYQISKKAEKYIILDESFGEEVYAVGARLTDKALIVEIDSALAKLKENGKAAEISKKWFGSDIVK